MARIFVYEGRDLPDLDPALSVDQIREHYTQFFPELNNADTRQGKRGDNEEITFTRRTGTKGQEKAGPLKWEMRQIEPEDLVGFNHLRPWGAFCNGQLIQAYSDRSIAEEVCQDQALYADIKAELKKLEESIQTKRPGVVDYDILSRIYNLLLEELY